jgi:hypothetical protein
LLKVGDRVHVMLDISKGLWNDKKLHGSFRYGDLHFSRETYIVQKLILRPNDREIRYKININQQHTYKRSE